MWWRFSPLCLLGAFVGCVAPATEPPPPLPPPPQARLALSASQLALGDVPLLYGERRWATGVVRVANVGDPGTTLEVSASGADCVGQLLGQTCVPDAQPWHVGVEAPVDVPVALLVDRLGPRFSALTFSTADGGTAVVTLAAEGVERPDCLVAEPGLVDFAPFPVGCPVTQQQVRLVNQCLNARVAYEADVAPVTEPFVVLPAPSLPRRLEPGRTTALSVQFTGGAPGPHAAVVTVLTDQAPVEVALRGARVNQAPPSDTFVQPPWSLDLLLVIDASPTFPQASRVAAAQNVLRSMQNATWFSGPLRVGLVGTGEATLRARPDGGTVFLSTDFDFEPALGAALVAATDGGSELEDCIDTAARFVPDAGAFFRDGPAHAAYCITDAPEQSPNAASSADALARANVRWNVVGPPATVPPGCQVEAPGDGQHEQLAAQLGGSVASICDLPWGLPWPGAVSTVPRYRFPLSFSPVFPLRVEVNGTPAPADSWLYEAAPNAVLFSAAPAEGSTVTVTNGLVCP